MDRWGDGSWKDGWAGVGWFQRSIPGNVGVPDFEPSDLTKRQMKCLNVEIFHQLCCPASWHGDWYDSIEGNVPNQALVQVQTNSFWLAGWEDKGHLLPETSYCDPLTHDLRIGCVPENDPAHMWSGQARSSFNLFSSSRKHRQRAFDLAFAKAALLLWFADFQDPSNVWESSRYVWWAQLIISDIHWLSLDN